MARLCRYLSLAEKSAYEKILAHKAHVLRGKRMDVKKDVKPTPPRRSGWLGRNGGAPGRAAAAESEEWVCSHCRNINWAFRQQCNLCNTSKE